jgi:5-formyltetrahydrofolate cyclo-ligase
MRRSATKERLREEFLEVRRSLSFEEVYSLSAAVQERFLRTGYYRSASRLAIYSSFRNEVVTEDILAAAVEDGRKVFFPRVTTRPPSIAGGDGGGKGDDLEAGGPHLEFYRVDHAGELSPGSFEILEPSAKGLMAAPLDLGVMVVPGVAFDREGARIGFGKGYYDRALSGVTCPIVGLAFESQIYDGSIPVEPHDVRMTAIVTESAVYEI